MGVEWWSGVGREGWGGLRGARRRGGAPARGVDHAGGQVDDGFMGGPGRAAAAEPGDSAGPSRAESPAGVGLTGH